MGRKRRAVDRLPSAKNGPKPNRHNRRGRPRNVGSPENPSVPLDPDAWEELGWLSRSDAGVRVTHKTAIAHPPIMRAINLIARGVAKLPWNVLALAGGDDTSIDWEHSAQMILTRKANPSIRAYKWKSTMLYHALLRGNGYSAIVRRGNEPESLILLDPTKTEPFWSAGDLWYKTEAGGQKRRLPAADVVHFSGLGFDGIVGHDILSVMANTFGLGPAARKWLSKLLSRGSTAGGLLQLPRELSADARKKRQEEFDRFESGLDNAFKTLALEDGAKWIRTMITPQEAAIFQVLAYDAKSVGNVFGVPPHKLGDDSKVAYNSLEQENASWLDECLDPWCVECETELTDKLLTTREIEERTHEVYIDRTALKLGDLQSQANSFGKLTNDGLMLPDEARARMGLPPLPNGEGKKLRLPVNIAVDGVIASQAGAAAADAAPTDPPATDPPAPPAGAPLASSMTNATRELLADRLRRLSKIHAENGPKAVARGPEAAADFARNHAERIRDALAPVLPVLALANGLAAPRRTAAEIADLLQCGADIDAQVEQVLSLSLQE